MREPFPMITPNDGPHRIKDEILKYIGNFNPKSIGSHGLAREMTIQHRHLITILKELYKDGMIKLVPDESKDTPDEHLIILLPKGSVKVERLGGYTADFNAAAAEESSRAATQRLVERKERNKEWRGYLMSFISAVAGAIIGVAATLWQQPGLDQKLESQRILLEELKGKVDAITLDRKKAGLLQRGAINSKALGPNKPGSKSAQ